MINRNVLLLALNIIMDDIVDSETQEEAVKLAENLNKDILLNIKN